MDGVAYNPPAEIVPTGGLIDQVTAVFPDPLTDAENCWVCEELRVTLPGFNVTFTAGVSETVALAVFAGSAALTAVTVTF